MRRSLPSLLAVLGSFLLVACTTFRPGEPGPLPESRWFKGNLHTHSFWSDGDDYPEMIADWYKQNGYHFLAISDHNVVHEGRHWIDVIRRPTVRGRQFGGGARLEKYIARFGPDWVEQREVEGIKEVRLKPLEEYRALLEEAGRFLMIPSEEISSRWTSAGVGDEPERGGPVHLNATNLRDHIEPVSGGKALDVMQQMVDAVLAQREATGQAMIPHVNHPNFQWAITAEELMQVRNERFFEVYNGHPRVNNDGDATRLGMDAMWDAILTRRLTDLDLGVMYGVAVDDAHNHHVYGPGKSNPGRGWVMVRARHLTPESIIDAMEAGDFYATTGVVLSEVRRAEGELAVEIEPEPGVTYVTQFIGTRAGFDPATELIPPSASEAPVTTLPHRRYSEDVGAVLAEARGTRATYRLAGDEIYVRAKIVSSKPKENGSVEGEFETAWTQPLVPTRTSAVRR